MNQQLRRTGLEPADYAEGDRKRIVEGLGGYPGAIILAAEYVESAGISEILRDVTGKKGVYTRIVERVLRKLHLNENESRVLSLLAEARAPIPPSVIARVTPFDPMPAIQDLRRLALIDRHGNDFISIAGILRGFADIGQPSPRDLEAFHIAAASAFSELAARAETVDQLRWIVEARYHAFSAGREDLAPELKHLADGAIGALSTFVKRNNYEAALPLVDRLLASHRPAEVLELGAVVYSRLGKCDQALVLAKEAVSIQPQRVWILTEVGRLSLNVHRVEIAEDALRIAKANGTDSTFIATLEGLVWQRKNQPAEAIEAFRRGVHISEYDGWPHFYLGRLLIEQGHPGDAIGVLESGEEIETTRYRPRRRVLTAIRTQLALAYLHTDDVANADRWLAIVAEEDAANPEVARAFAYLRIKKGETDVASRALEDLDPSRAKNRHERAQIHLFRGLFYLSIGAAARASEEFNQANLADPQNVFVLLRWSETLLNMAREASGQGEPEAARVCADRVKEVARKVLKFDSDNQRALEILEQVYDEFHIA
jgi:Tfp pilus assembly protein PilF